MYNENECPHCGENIEIQESIEGNYSPKEDDVCLCVYCGNINKYAKNLKIVPMTEGEIMVLADTYPEMMVKIKVAQGMFAAIFGKKQTISLN